MKHKVIAHETGEKDFKNDTYFYVFCTPPKSLQQASINWLSVLDCASKAKRRVKTEDFALEEKLGHLCVFLEHEIVIFLGLLKRCLFE